jgi:hypothetical protein
MPEVDLGSPLVFADPLAYVAADALRCVMRFDHGGGPQIQW